MRKCFRCHHKECFGFDWCNCTVCDMNEKFIKEYEEKQDEYIKAMQAQKTQEAEEIKKALDGMTDKIAKKVEINL